LQLYNRDLPSGALLEKLSAPAARRQLIDLEAVMGIARRQWVVVALCATIGAMLGIAYVMTATPLYTAGTSVMIDRGDTSQVVAQLSTAGPAPGEEEAMITSQIALLQSQAVIGAVVDKLDLTNDPEFIGQPSAIATVKNGIKSLISLTGLYSPKEAQADTAARRQAAIEQVGRGMAVARAGRSYVLGVAYTSPSAALSARIANAIGDAYLDDKLESRYEATRRAGSWLEGRIAELRQKALEADLAVQKFRAEHGLVSAGQTLMSDQQLTELNSALIVAQSETAQARAKHERIQKIIDAGQGDAIVNDVLDSSISNELRQKYLEAAKTEADISQRLGPDHVQAVRLRGEMAEYRRQMFEELSRIAQSYQSELEVAEARQKSLQESVDKAMGVTFSANETQVQLRELEREADTYKNLYQNFLQKHQEALQQQSFPLTEARVITKATEPDRASHPKKLIMLVAFCFLGAFAGAGIGAFREFRDRFFRTGDQVRDVLDLEFIGTAPMIDENAGKVPEVPAGLSPRALRKSNVASNYVIDHPLSSFAETLRSAKIAADLTLAGKDCKVIGIVSTLPGEGKSTTAINFAELLASQGARTVLIDGDLRNPGATRAIGLHAEEGILEAILEKKPVGDLLLYNPQTKLAFLPAVIKRRVPHSAELIGSLAMRDILTSLSAEADYIIVDLPPLGAVVDARAAANRIDSFIYVVEWGKTARRVVRQTIGNEPQVRDKTLGVILNKVDHEKMKLYRTYGSSEYYYSRYSEYYQENK